MESQEKIINEQESLQIIQNMINAAKSKISVNGFHYLLWGWLVFIASLSNYVLLFVVKYEYHFLPWVILMPAGGIIAAIAGSKHHRKKGVRTVIDRMMRFLWISVGAGIFISMYTFFQSEGLYGYPILIMVYGIGLFVSGGTLKFTPLIVGGICCWIISLVATNFEFDVQLLLLSLSVLIGYIIPGHILQARYKNENI